MEITIDENQQKIKELAEFAKFIKENYTDKYGHLRISDISNGEFIYASYEEVAEEFLK